VNRIIYGLESHCANDNVANRVTELLVSALGDRKYNVLYAVRQTSTIVC